MNIDQLKQDLCRQMAVIGMIEKSQQRARVIATCTAHYMLWSSERQMLADVAKQNKVTQRLVNYLTVLTQKP